jgi:hypothetical protein
MQVQDASRRTWKFALVSGVLGLLAVGLLIAALAAPTPSPQTMRRETNLFLLQDAGVILQALAMIPVTIGLYRLSLSQNATRSRNCLLLGLIAQSALITTSGLIFSDTVSDMLYMAPIGLVGLWLLMVSHRDSMLSSGVIWTGRIAGFGLLLVGLGFVLYGIFVAPAIFLRPLSTAEVDAQTLTLPNLIAHVCLGAGTLLGRLVYPVWALLLGLNLSRRSTLPTTQPTSAMA